MKKLCLVKNLIIFLLITFLMIFIIKIQAFSKSSHHVTNHLAQLVRKNMVYVRGGTYTMGPTSDKWADGMNSPAHKVKLTSFYISKYNTSYAEFDLYTKAAKLKKIRSDAIGSYSRSPDHPVVSITWNQANNFCKWLSKKTGLPYSLPTEAQWEFAATARGRRNWAFATDNGNLVMGKNFPSHQQEAMQKGNLASIYSAMPNGSYPPNPLGLFDMNGQADQWMLDWFSPDYYSRSPLLNPKGPESGSKKVVRGGDAGGSFEDNVYHRAGFKPSFAEAGFRCVINSSVPPNKLGAFAKGHPKH